MQPATGDDSAAAHDGTDTHLPPKQFELQFNDVSAALTLQTFAISAAALGPILQFAKLMLERVVEAAMPLPSSMRPERSRSCCQSFEPDKVFPETFSDVSAALTGKLNHHPNIMA